MDEAKVSEMLEFLKRESEERHRLKIPFQEFLALQGHLQMVYEDQLQKEDCLEVIAEISALKSTQFKEMVQQYLPSIELDHEIQQRLARFESREFHPDKLYKNDSYLLPLLKYLFNAHYNKEYKGLERQRKCSALDRVFIAMEMKMILDSLALNPDELLFVDRGAEVPRDMHRLGFLEGRLECLDDLESQDLQKIIHGSKSQRAITERWEPLKIIKEEAVKRARKRWENDDPLLHNEMADDLLPELQDAFKEELERSRFKLTRRIIMDALKPLAKEKDRLRGAKGVRKRKK